MNTVEKLEWAMTLAQEVQKAKDHVEQVGGILSLYATAEKIHNLSMLLILIGLVSAMVDAADDPEEVKKIARLTFDSFMENT